MNKKFLKTMAAGMAALMLAGSLVGCGTNASNTKDQGSSGAELQGTKIAVKLKMTY